MDDELLSPREESSELVDISDGIDETTSTTSPTGHSSSSNSGDGTSLSPISEPTLPDDVIETPIRNSFGSVPSKSTPGFKYKKPMKNIKPASKIDMPVASPKREPRSTLWARTGRLGGGTTKTASSAGGSSKTTTTDKYPSSVPPIVGLLRGKSLGSISRQKSSVCSSCQNSPRPRSARERVSDNNKLKVFESLFLKLQSVQTEFMLKFENLKGSIPERLNREFKFIAMVQDGNCKLVVHSDYLKKLPSKLPTHAVADFKNEIQEVLNGCLKTFHEEVKKEGGLHIGLLEERLEQEQARRLSTFFEKIDNLCSVTDTMERDVMKYKKLLLEAKRFAEEQQRQMIEQKKAYGSEVIVRVEGLKTKHDVQMAKKNETIADLKRAIKSLQEGREKLREQVESCKNEQIAEQEKHARVAEEIKSLKETQMTLSKLLQHSEVGHKLTLRALMDKNAEISKFQEELEHRKKFFEDYRSRAKAGVAQQLLEKSKEIMQLKATIEENKRDYAELEEHLNAARKDLKKFRDTIAEVERCKAAIKKLKEDLVEKEKELEERPLGPAQYPAEILRLQRLNRRLRRKIEELNTSLLRYKRNCAQLLEQMKHDCEMKSVRRKMVKAIKQNQADQRDRMKVCEDVKEMSEFKMGVQSKSAELQDLLSKLGSKQMALSRREHMLKLVSERLDRNELLRVKQQERIARLEEERFELKEIIRRHNSGEI